MNCHKKLANGGFFSTLKPQFSFDGSVLTIQRDFAIYRCAEDTVRNDALSQETNITVRLKSLGLAMCGKSHQAARRHYLVFIAIIINRGTPYKIDIVQHLKNTRTSSNLNCTFKVNTCTLDF